MPPLLLMLPLKHGGWLCGMQAMQDLRALTALLRIVRPTLCLFNRLSCCCQPW